MVKGLEIEEMGKLGRVVESWILELRLSGSLFYF